MRLVWKSGAEVRGGRGAAWWNRALCWYASVRPSMVSMHLGTCFYVPACVPVFVHAYVSLGGRAGGWSDGVEMMQPGDMPDELSGAVEGWLRDEV